MRYTCLGNCKPAAFVVLWNKCVKCALFSWMKVTPKLTVKKQDTHTYDTPTKPNYFWWWFYQWLSQILQNSIFMLETNQVFMCETAFQWSCKDTFTCVRQHFSEASRTYPWSFLVVIPGPGETKVSNLQNVVVRHKHVACCQVTMNALWPKMIHAQVSTKIMHADTLLHRWRQ